MRVHELVCLLNGCDPQAHVEFEVPKPLPADRDPIVGARCPIEDVIETFYNEPDNKWVVLS